MNRTKWLNSRNKQKPDLRKTFEEATISKARNKIKAVFDCTYPDIELFIADGAHAKSIVGNITITTFENFY